MDTIEPATKRIGTVVKLWELETPTAAMYLSSKPTRKRIRPSRGEFAIKSQGPGTDDQFNVSLDQYEEKFSKQLSPQQRLEMLGQLRVKYGHFPSPSPLPNVHRAALVGLSADDAKAVRKQLRNQRKRARQRGRG
jgi:hypothetical protein